MLASKTVFVLGAGASHELGFPLGAELADRISKKLKFSPDDFPDRTASGDKEIFRALLNVAKSKEVSVSVFLPGARRINEGIQFSTSIDNFIDVHKNDKSVELCGKLAIARSILEAERNSAVFIDKTNAFSDFKDPDKAQSSWMQKFVRLVQDGINKSDPFAAFENITFVNFNYDRSLEQFLYHALKRLYGADDFQSANWVKSLKVIRPYGSLGLLPWQGHQGTEYGALADASRITSIYERIRTFGEQLDDKQMISELQNEIRYAKSIVFLGFGFHRQNMELLTSGARSEVSSLFATAYEVSKNGCDVILDQIHQMIGFDTTLMAEHKRPDIRRDLTCSKLFDVYWQKFAIG